MKKHATVLVLVVATGVAASASVIPAGQQSSGAASDWCRGEQWGNDRQGVCEVRDFTVAAGAGAVGVDAAPNGGIQVSGEGRADILVHAKVVATADTLERAQQIASAVRVDTTPDKISAQGPRGLDRREGWHVSYRLEVPTQTSLALQTTNGGIAIDNVEGRIEFKTVNGGVKLSGLAGDVRGRTSNGGVDVDLDGTAWRGEGLDVETSNGGVKLRIPEQYSAHLEAGTVNGGFSIDFPVTVQGRVDREINADIGAGGPPIRVKTHNGGIKVTRK